MGSGKRIPLFRTTSGLNTIMSHHELGHDPETGSIEIARALNIDISNSGRRISRRKGYSRLVSGSFHSAFCAGGDILCVQEHATWGSLYRFNPSDASLTGIRSGLSKNRRMAYCQVDSRIYYSNGAENGIYEDGSSTSWVRGEYVGHENFKELFDPPLGTYLEIIGGYMLIGERSNLWVSEEFDFSAYNLANRRFTFEEDISMVKAVVDGVWVGTEKRTCFLAGTEPEKWQITKDVNCGVCGGSAAQYLVQSSLLALEGVSGDGALWLGSRGIVWGGPGGTYVNLTENRLDSSQIRGNFGSGCVTGSKAIFTVEP